MLTIKQKLAKNYINARGWKTKRKLLLIESDDWGAVRIPSRNIYESFLKKGIAVDKHYFDRNDSLENEKDLEELFNVLLSFKDIKGNPSVITAFSIVANPDFDLIAANNKIVYHYENILETYKRQANTENSFEVIVEGMKNHLFYPQFHGREHVHVNRWMNAINSDSIKEKYAFNNKAIISSDFSGEKKNYSNNYFDAFEYFSNDEFIQI